MSLWRKTTPEQAQEQAKQVAERAAARGNPVAKKIVNQINKDDKKGGHRE